MNEFSWQVNIKSFVNIVWNIALNVIGICACLIKTAVTCTTLLAVKGIKTLVINVNRSIKSHVIFTLSHFSHFSHFVRAAFRHGVSNTSNEFSWQVIIESFVNIVWNIALCGLNLANVKSNTVTFTNLETKMCNDCWLAYHYLYHFETSI